MFGIAGKRLLGPLRGVCGSQTTPRCWRCARRLTITAEMRASPSRVGHGRDRPRPTRGGDAERTLSGPPPQAMRPGRKTTSRNGAVRKRRHRPGQVISLPCEPAGRLHVPVHDVGRQGSRVEAAQVNSRRSSCPSSFGGRSDTARSPGTCVRTLCSSAAGGSTSCAGTDRVDTGGRGTYVSACSSRWSRRGPETLTVACAVDLGVTGGHPISPWPEAGREGVWLCDRVGGEGRQAAGCAGVGELQPLVFGRLRTGGFDARQGEDRAEGLRPAGPGATLHPERDTHLGTRIPLILADCKRMMRSACGHV